MATATLQPPKNKPRTLEDHAGYRLAVEKLTELKVKRDQLDERCRRIQTRINGHHNGDVGPDPLDTAAEALLDGKDATVRPTLDGLQEQVGEAYAERETVVRAIELQQKRIEEQRLKASRLICEGLTPEFKRCLQTVATAAEQMLAAGGALHDLFERMDRERIIAHEPCTTQAAIPGWLSTSHRLKTWLQTTAGLR